MFDLDSIRTPILLLDEARCRRNIQRMINRAAAVETMLRPHFKTHQSIQVGRWMRQSGIDKIACSSFGMAHYFAGDGWNDITVAFPVNLRQRTLIDHLANTVKLTVLVQDAEVIRSLDASLSGHVKALIKIDVGSHRTGIDTLDDEAILTCINAIKSARHMTWAGFLAHAGHTYNARSADEVAAIHLAASQKFVSLRGYLELGNGEAYLTYGDTPSCSVAPEGWSGIDEIRPGNYVFYDMMQVQIGSCSLDDVAVAVACPVVAVHPSQRKCIVYGGGIHFAKDFIELDQGARSYGTAVALSEGGWSTVIDDCYLKSLSQEHGVVSLPESMVDSVKPGDLMGFLPVHSCMTAECLGSYLSTDGSRVDHFARASV